MAKRIEHIEEDGVEKKWCGKCKSFKPLEKFGYAKSSWDSFRPTCKDCLKEQNKENKEQRKEYNKEFWKKNKKEQTEKHKKWVEENKEYIKQKNKEWLENNKEHKKEYDKQYRIANLEKKREYNKVWKRNNYKDMKTNPERKEELDEYKIKSNIGRRIRESIANNTNGCCKYTGCLLIILKKHLSNTMEEGMTWNNYGTYKKKENIRTWHIDHIIPSSSFNMSNDIERKACWHYKNLRACWWDDNIVKSNKFDKEEKDRYMRWFIETQLTYV